MVRLSEPDVSVASNHLCCVLAGTCFRYGSTPASGNPYGPLVPQGREARVAVGILAGPDRCRTPLSRRAMASVLALTVVSG